MKKNILKYSALFAAALAIFASSYDLFITVEEL